MIGQLELNLRQMSEQQQGYGSARSEARRGAQEQEQERQAETERVQAMDRLHESPTRHDVEFFVRKVNRYEAEIVQLEETMSLLKFRLSKAEDYQAKYDQLFKANQDTTQLLEVVAEEKERGDRENDRLRVELEQAKLSVRNLSLELENAKRSVEDQRAKREELRNKASSDDAEERGAIKQNYLRELEDLKRSSRQREQQLTRELQELKVNIAHKDMIEGSISFKLQKIRKEKDAEIDRLKELAGSLKQELSNGNQKRDNKLWETRSNLIEETESRISGVRKLANTIEEALLEEIRQLNVTLGKKNQEIEFLIDCDKKALADYSQSENGLRLHIKRLEDKMFVVQRENEIELFRAIARLKAEYDSNVQALNAGFDRVRTTHSQQIKALQDEISGLKKEIDLLDSENRTLQAKHKQLAQDKEQAVAVLSQKLIGMESAKDIDLRNYTTSMKQIQEDTAAKLDDLRNAIENKNSEVDILNAQLALKNKDIDHLLEEISNLRHINREKLKGLGNVNASEQNALNNEISVLKQSLLRLKGSLHETEEKLADQAAQSKLLVDKAQEELTLQKQANQMLQSRNDFLANWCKQLQRDLKNERTTNVNILHDGSISRRETVQVREQVRVELEAIKAKEVQQIRNVFKLEKGRLESDLAQREHDLREKKEELARLLVEYKNLESKVGKSSKLDRNSQEEGKCKATLQAEILLTENIFNSINRQ